MSVAAPYGRRVANRRPRPRRPGPRQARTGLDRIGLDIVGLRARARSHRGLWLAAVAATVGAALCVAALRTEILRTRYRLAEAAAREEQLLDARDKLRVTVRELRDPVRLSKLATDLGFGAPERVIDLDLPRGPGGGS